MFSHAWTRLHIFSRLEQVTCFPALGTGGMFSRAWNRLHIFPRLETITFFLALGNGCRSSGTSHYFDCFLIVLISLLLPIHDFVFSGRKLEQLLLLLRC